MPGSAAANTSAAPDRAGKRHGHSAIRMFFDSGPIKNSGSVKQTFRSILNYALEKGAKTPATLPQVIVNLRPAKH